MTEQKSIQLTLEEAVSFARQIPIWYRTNSKSFPRSSYNGSFENFCLEFRRDHHYRENVHSEGGWSYQGLVSPPTKLVVDSIESWDFYSLVIKERDRIIFCASYDIPFENLDRILLLRELEKTINNNSQDFVESAIQRIKDNLKGGKK